MTNSILALNAGSSSLKFGLFGGGTDHDPPEVCRGVIRSVGRNDSQIIITGPDGGIILRDDWPTTTKEVVIKLLLGWIEGTYGPGSIGAVGHRIVHGGAEFADPVLVDDVVLAKLDALTSLAPLHQPTSLEPVRIVAALRTNLVQIACFDTSFHRTIRPPACRYALPRACEAQGIRRYGFHGLSYESITAQLAKEAEPIGKEPPSRLIVAHLGNGASLCAMRGLKSVDTTMGFSTLDGLVMGTRPGSLDPGILLYLIKEKGYSPDLLEQLLYRESGLLGVSEISADVATLLASSSPAAAEALDLFAFSVARHAAALAATLGGLERFIFTGGIGENAAAVRAMVVKRLEWLGAELDENANEAGAQRVSTDQSSVLIECRRTNEELAIARQVRAILEQ